MKIDGKKYVAGNGRMIHKLRFLGKYVCEHLRAKNPETQYENFPGQIPFQKKPSHLSFQEIKKKILMSYMDDP